MKRIITFGLLISISLTACTVGIVKQETLPAPSGSALPTPEVTLDFAAPEDQPTLTPAQATSVPTLTVAPTLAPAPTITSVPVQAPVTPQVFSFEVTPTEVEPGDTVTLTWEARGDQATVCPNHVNSDDCWQVLPTGMTSFVLPIDSHRVSRFILTIRTHDWPSSAIAEATIRYRCDTDWFFRSGTLYGQECPVETVRSFAAAQHFERGTMIWIEQLGRYIILTESLVFEEGLQKQVYYAQDPLTIVRDTSAGTVPPEGLYAPESGFGLVWRGDVSQSPGYRESLGWAVEAEFGYETVHQCTPGFVSGGRFWQSCYLQGPDGEVIYFHPLGGWFLQDE